MIQKLEAEKLKRLQEEHEKVQLAEEVKANIPKVRERQDAEHIKLQERKQTLDEMKLEK